MSGPWEQFQAQPAESGPWAIFGGANQPQPMAPSNPAAPRKAEGVFDAIQAGYQGSATGLAFRGKLPDIELDPHHSKWYERAAAGLAQVGAEFVPGVVGAFGGGAAGAAAGTALPLVGNVVGGVVGAGAGAFAVPAAIRESLIQAYSKGEVTSTGDFLDRAAIVLKTTGKEGLIGAVTGGLGKAAQVGAAAAKVGAKTTAAAVAGAELTALTITPAALEGRLPEPQDFVDGAVLLVGIKGATRGAQKLREIYAKTGKTPAEVLADAAADPTIAEDLGAKRVEPAVDPAKAQESKPVDLAEPKPGEQLDLFPKEELPRAYQELARRENAREAVPDPSPEAAKFLDTPLAKVPQLPGEPVLKTHVNYDRLNTTDEVKGAMARLSELYEADIRTATRGEVTWEQTYAEARKMFEDTTGEKVPALALENADYAKLSADLYARKQLLVSGAEQLMVLQKSYAEARANGMATDQMKLQILAQIDRVAQAQAAVRGSQAEVGRALNILKSTNRDKAYFDELTGIINGRFGVDGAKFAGENFDAMVDMMGELGSPKEALKFAETASKATTWQKVTEAWKAGMVSGPITQIANVLGNVTFALTRPVIDTVAVGVGRIRPGTDVVAGKEVLGRVVGNFHGALDAAKVLAGSISASAKGAAAGTKQLAVSAAKLDTAGAKEGWQKLGESLDAPLEPGKAEVNRKAIEGTGGAIIRLPFRALSGADSFFRTMNERGEAYSLAIRETIKEGYNPDTREFKQRVAELVANPTEAMADAIQTAGQRFTFNAPMGETGKAVQRLIKTGKLEWAVPFVQTPINVTKEMLRLTPAAPIVKEWREAIKKGGPEADKAIAEMAAGTALGTAVFGYALSGNVTGQGDPDPKKRAAMMASGWQPYSIKIGDTYYSYQRFQPVGTLIGMAADAAAVWDNLGEDERDKLPKIISTAFSNAITNQTFLQGITNIINAMSGPDQYGAKFVQMLVSSGVPGILSQPAQMLDPYQREVYSILDAVKARIPGLREDLMPKRDIFGEKIETKERLGGLSPIVTTTESQDKVRLEAARLGVATAKAPAYIELPAGRDPKLGRVELTPEQRDLFASAAGKQAYQILNLVVNAPGWDNVPDLVQRNVMSKVFEDSRKAGKLAALPPEQLIQEATRIANELQIRLQPK